MKKYIGRFIQVMEVHLSKDYVRWKSADHCIEYLRQAAMCHGDVSLTTFVWDTAQSLPILSPKRVPHKCVDWAQLESFAKDRSVSLAEMERMKNPTLSDIDR